MSDFNFQPGESYATEQDARDPLQHYRERFYIPRINGAEECIYLAGHSLGLQPKSAKKYIEEELEEWS